MFGFLRGRTGASVLRGMQKCGAIGVDTADDSVKMVQLCNAGKGVSLIAGGFKTPPPEVKPGTGTWQRWAIDAIRDLTAKHKFRGKDVIAAIPAKEVFIDHIKMPNIKDNNEEKLHKAIIAKIKQKLPFEAKDAMIKCIPAEEHNAMVVAADRKVIDRHLAIYENAGLHLKSIGVWPLALTNTYTKLFARRKVDTDSIVMLLEISTNCTNTVICRPESPLFACSISVGTKDLTKDKAVTKLVLELSACKRQFSSTYKKSRIERLIFISTQVELKEIYTKIAKQLEMPAQMGDYLAAVKIGDPRQADIVRGNGQVNWATAFGLSLS